MNLRGKYIEFARETSVEGSNKASSYIKALEHLGSMLKIESFGFPDCLDIFNVTSIDRLDDLYTLVQREKNLPNPVWLSTGIPQSYLKNDFCNAAIRNYQLFLNSRRLEDVLFDEFTNHKGDSASLVEKLNSKNIVSEKLIENANKKIGKDIVRNVKARVGQDIFRKMVFVIYNNTCCVSGLNIQKLNIASHIIPWSENEKTRLDPTNGLCLSRTYDVAFDKNLISFDDEYRIILSKEIREYYKNENVKEYFLKKEGKQIYLPEKYLPNKDYLEQHRLVGDFR